MDAHTAVLNFRDAIIASHAQWQVAANAALKAERGFLDESFGDWAQVQWELLVERVLCLPTQFLNIYGSGSDYEMAIHSRVFFHNATPSHEIACECDDPTLDRLSGDNIDLRSWQFDRFVAFNNNWYDESPPFDCLLLNDTASGANAVIGMSGVSFRLRPVENAT